MLQGNPMVQNLLSDPEVLRTMFESNPQLRQVRVQAAATCSGSLGTSSVHSCKDIASIALQILLRHHLKTEQPLSIRHVLHLVRQGRRPMLHQMPAPLIAALTASLHLQLMDQHPEVAQLLNNPQQLRDAFAAASNPVSPRGGFFKICGLS